MMRATSHPIAPDLAGCLAQMDRGRIYTRTVRMEPNQAFEGYAQPLRDAVGLFNELKLPYALAGGLAAMLYGRARFTEDVDFVVVSGHEAVLAAHGPTMQRYGFDPGSTWKLYHGSGVEIDLWKDEHADAIVSRAYDVDWAGGKVRVTDPHDLIAMKLRANRPQDDYDISEILKHATLNEREVESRVTGVQFQHFLEIKRRIGL